MLAAFATVLLAAPPNVVVVMTDDQGFGDLSFYGNPVLRTPNLDRLAVESARLDDFHVAPMCTPTRGQLLTGIDALENRAMNVSSGRSLLRPDLPTLADHLAAAGYSTGLFGKWHLGDNRTFRPHDRGFETALWFPSSHIGSVPDHWNNDYFGDTYLLSGEAANGDGYCTDRFFAAAIDWIADQRKPFFAYIAPNAAHFPHFVPDRYRGPIESRLNAARESGLIEVNGLQARFNRQSLISFLAMIENIDENVGRLLDALVEEDRLDDTIFVFLTDNGSTFGHAYYPCGMRGKKTELWEGGHRVPCFLRYPGFQARDIPGLTQVQDLVPTILDVCGVDPLPGPPLDGVSLKSTLVGEATIDPERTLVINYSRMPFGRDRPTDIGRPQSIPTKDGAGVLRGRWRWLNDAELYDLQTDPLQQQDVAADFPEVAADLAAVLDDWWDGVTADPRWLDPVRIPVGGDLGSADRLTACEWLDVFVDQQLQIRRGIRRFGRWHVDVQSAGTYRFELRRFPRESGLAIDAAVPQVDVTDGTLPGGPAFPIESGRLRLVPPDANTLASYEASEPTSIEAATTGMENNALIGLITLPQGEQTLEADLLDAAGDPVCGAYYLTLTRIR